MDMICTYKDTFRLRDEIGTCPNIEVEIDNADKSPFFIRPYCVKEEMKRLCCSGIWYLAVAYIIAIICIYYYTAAYNTPETQNYDCVSYSIRSNPK